MDDRIKESLSALIDSQADELEIRRLLNEHSDQMRDKWRRYSLISDVLRDQPLADLDLDISQGIRQALNGEPMDELAPMYSSEAQSQSSSWVRWLSLGSSAAAITLAVFMGLNFSDQSWMSQNQNVVALQAMTPKSLSVSTVSQNSQVKSINSTDELVVQQNLEAAQYRLNEYLRQHVEDNAMNSLRGIAPLARSASFRQP